MKISKRDLIFFFGFLAAVNLFLVYRYRNLKPYYQYEMIIKTKAIFYDEVQHLCKKISNPEFWNTGSGLQLSDTERENINAIKSASYKEEEFYIFSMKIEAKDSAELLSAAGKIQNIFTDDKYLKEKFFDREKDFQEMSGEYSGLMRNTVSKQYLSDSARSINIYDMKVKHYMAGYINELWQKELSLQPVSGNKISYVRPDFFRKYLLSNIIAAVAVIFIFIFFRSKK